MGPHETDAEFEELGFSIVEAPLDTPAEESDLSLQDMQDIYYGANAEAADEDSTVWMNIAATFYHTLRTHWDTLPPPLQSELQELMDTLQQAGEA